MKIALIKNIKYDFDQVLIVTGNDDSFCDDVEYVRISEYIDVDFKMIEVDITAAKVAGIDEEISKAEAGIHLLKQAKAELLALPDMRAE